MKVSKIALIIIFQFVFLYTYSQSNPYAIKFSHQIETEVAEGSLKPSKAGLLHSFIGNYHLANTYSDFPVSWGVDNLVLVLDTRHLIKALPKIVLEAAKHQIVIISENHLKPQHRIFAKQIITALRDLGYDHLGLETFSSNNNSNVLLDSDLVQRGYPLNSQLTGIYTMEPQMGQLVREAIQSGYKLFAYERSQKIKGMDRDEIQADNVIRYLNAHPNEKVIILCGLHHAVESDLPKRIKHQWMAKYIKDKTGIDPLTIFQDNFTEKFILNEHPALSQLNILEPSISVSEDGKIFQFTPQVDIEVIHPKTVYKNGRPNWLYENDNFKTIKITKEIENLNYPLIASAFKIGEENSVPIDRIELKHKYDNNSFVLTPGNYRFNLFDGENKLNYEIIVE